MGGARAATQRGAPAGGGMTTADGDGDIYGPRQIKLLRSCDGLAILETWVQILDCEENIFGEDVVAWKCGACGEIHTSRRFG
jgi:hypothetical protein